MALPGSSLGDGLAVKAAASGGVYDYESRLSLIDANYYGGVVSLVEQWSGAWGWANVSAGARATRTNLTPADPANSRDGLRIDAVVGTDGAFGGGPWRLGWYAEGGVRDESYLARVQLTREVIAKRLRLGVEGSVSGDPLYRAQSAGLALTAPIGGKVELQLSGGLQFQKGRSEEVYVSIGFSKLF